MLCHHDNDNAPSLWYCSITMKMIMLYHYDHDNALSLSYCSISTTIIMLYKNTNAMVTLILLTLSLKTCQEIHLNISIDIMPRLCSIVVNWSNERKWFILKKKGGRRKPYPTETITYVDYTDDLALQTWNDLPKKEMIRIETKQATFVCCFFVCFCVCF